MTPSMSARKGWRVVARFFAANSTSEELFWFTAQSHLQRRAHLTRSILRRGD